MRNESTPTNENESPRARRHRIAATMRARRMQLKRSQIGVADDADVHPSSVSLLERGAKVSAATIAKVAAVLGIRPEELLQ